MEVDVGITVMIDDIFVIWRHESFSLTRNLLDHINMLIHDDKVHDVSVFVCHVVLSHETEEQHHRDRAQTYVTKSDGKRRNAFKRHYQKRGNPNIRRPSNPTGQ